MNKFKFSILIGTCVIMATACEDKLEEPQKGVYSIDTFYKTDEDAENALVGMYEIFEKSMTNTNGANIRNAFFFTYNLCGDDMYAAGEFYGDNDFMAQLNEFRYAADHEDLTNMYKSFYRIIYGANLVINNVPGETDIQKRCVAEARVIRAYAHMMLAIAWNDPPKITEVLSGSEAITNCDHSELLKWCGDECMEVMDDLDERQGTSDKNGTVKVTKGFAGFVAGKSYMFASKDGKEYMEDAKKALKGVISSGNYALVPGERIGETFLAQGDGNEEQIMATNFEYNSGSSDWNGIIDRSTWMYSNIMNWRSGHMAGSPEEIQMGWGGLALRTDWAYDFVKNDCGVAPDGLENFKYDGSDNSFDFENSLAYTKDANKDKRWRRNAWMKHINEVLYEMSYGPKKDLKKDGTPLTREEKESDSKRGIETYIYCYTYFWEYKRQARISELYPGKDNVSLRNTLLARYAEVLLLYAEACARTNDNDGLQYLQAIQKRAGSATVSDALTLDAVKEEKRFEMFAEGCRWADMVRWSQQDNDRSVFDRLKNNGTNIPELYDAMFDANGREKGAGDVEGKHRIYMVLTNPNGSNPTGLDASKEDQYLKYRYFPIPFSEIQVNPNIKQHPGWGTDESVAEE